MCEKMVSIIIRTHDRYEFLRIALESIKNQEYKNIEIIIVEDGPEKSKEKIYKEFAELNINYYSTVEKVGRVKAANIGLAVSKGEYINFLDDDDILLPNHVKLLANILDEYAEYDAVHSSSYEQKIKYIGEQVTYIAVKKFEKYNEPLNKEKIFFENMFPIQAVMFRRKLYEMYGGMDERFHLLEDWELWIRYSIESEFYFLNAVTSIYNIPNDRKLLKNKKDSMKEYENLIFNKYIIYIQNSSYIRKSKLSVVFEYINKYGVKKFLKKVMFKI
ncbi:glycosyltransferase [Clostridioides sp. ES-S-0108-01]|uniref:glycosyltransferase n=1 Tax=Clostridioides sp. ES-S-0108-01 TaxID=2770773 RepID=UPI001D0CA3B7|nr:glycosyltransferase [Clostridioides sp. ES-S-0108-01]UDN50435.1 glycosyltransferase [Clostridioides sp. ES-S-0107-01]